MPRRSGRTSDSRRLPPWWPWSTRDARPLVQSGLSARRNAVQVLSDSSAWPQAGRLGSRYFASCTQRADLISKLLPRLHILCRTEQPSLSTLPGPGPVPSSGPPGERPSRNHLTVGPPVLGGLKVGIVSGYVSKFGIECVYCCVSNLGRYFGLFSCCFAHLFFSRYLDGRPQSAPSFVWSSNPHLPKAGTGRSRPSRGKCGGQARTPGAQK